MRLCRTLSSASVLVWMQVQIACAQVFNGPGLKGGVGEAAGINGPVNAPLREIVLQMLYRVLGMLAFAATIVVIGAGVYLVIGAGSEDSKNKAKTIILYVAIGLIVVFLARSIVGFLMYGLL